jgi:hypothetical protein
MCQLFSFLIFFCSNSWVPTKHRGAPGRYTFFFTRPLLLTALCILGPNSEPGSIRVRGCTRKHLRAKKHLGLRIQLFATIRPVRQVLRAPKRKYPRPLSTSTWLYTLESELESNIGERAAEREAHISFVMGLHWHSRRRCTTTLLTVCTVDSITLQKGMNMNNIYFYC